MILFGLLCMWAFKVNLEVEKKFAMQCKDLVLPSQSCTTGTLEIR